MTMMIFQDRFISLQRRASRYQPTGLECHILSKSETKNFHPHLTVDDLYGGKRYWLNPMIKYFLY